MGVEMKLSFWQAILICVALMSCVNAALVPSDVLSFETVFDRTCHLLWAACTLWFATNKL
jgi:hypothetical protein